MSLPRPEFRLVAGINGAGKSTFAKRMYKGACINPDLITAKIKRFLPIQDVANWLAVMYVEWILVFFSIRRKKSIIVETVLSSDKYMKHVMKAKELGFKIAMDYVSISSTDKSIERVQLRVLAGGHHVPDKSIIVRWDRTLDNMVAFLPLLDEFSVWDNSIMTKHATHIAFKNTSGTIEILDEQKLPELVKRLRNYSISLRDANNYQTI